MLRKPLKPLIATVLSFVTLTVWAQAATPPTGTFMDNNSQTVILFLSALILIVCLGVIIALTNLLLSSVADMRKDFLKEQGIVEEDHVEVDYVARFFKNLWQSANGAVDIEHEEEIELDHNYDGIRELDNNLPPWWKAMFYGAIVWAVAYMFYFHVFDMGPLQIEEFEIEMVEAQAKQDEYIRLQAESVDENTVTQLTDASEITKGNLIFDQRCAVCHLEKGIGSTGPNLTDDYWIHGGRVQDIFKIIKDGVPGKAMISWKKTLTPIQMQQLASYILSLEYVSVEQGGKAPEGNLMIEAVTDSLQAEIPLNDSLQVELPPKDSLQMEN